MSGPSEQAEQKERKALTGSTSATTYFQQSQVAEELDVTAGRFAKPSVVSGSEPTVRYPAAADWSSNGAGVGLEPPLGLDVNAVDPAGELHEIAASLDGSEGKAPAAAAAVETTSDPSIPRKLVRRRMK